MFSSTDFRTNFPEFNSTTAYPAGQVDFWIANAGRLVSVQAWGDVWDLGAQLFVAHNLVLERQAQITSAGGGVPGVSSGVVQSKSLDKGSISYDTTSAMEEGAGHWNLTSYGKRYWQLVKMFGSGGRQL